MSENTSFSPTENVDVKQSKRASHQKTSKDSFWKNNKGIIGWLCCALCICLSAFMFFDAVYTGADEALDAFSDGVQDATDSVHQEFYDMGVKAGEEAHHVKNVIAISLGRIREKMDLEVLQVCDVGYIPYPDNDEKSFLNTIKASISRQYPNNIVSWLGVSAYGTFTVDLRASEFIIDNDRQYVLVRIPRPKLSNYHLDQDKVESLYFDDGGLVKDSASVGQDIAQRHLQYAEGLLKKKAFSNQYYYKQACENAQSILESLIKQLNPKLPNLKVDVEFL